MSTPGARVIREGGAQGILTGGKISLFNTAGECKQCCGSPCDCDGVPCPIYIKDCDDTSQECDLPCSYYEIPFIEVSNCTWTWGAGEDISVTVWYDSTQGKWFAKVENLFDSVEWNGEVAVSCDSDTNAITFSPTTLTSTSHCGSLKVELPAFEEDAGCATEDCVCKGAQPNVTLSGGGGSGCSQEVNCALKYTDLPFVSYICYSATSRWKWYKEDPAHSPGAIYTEVEVVYFKASGLFDVFISNRSAIVGAGCVWKDTSANVTCTDGVLSIAATGTNVSGTSCNCCQTVSVSL